MGGAEQKYIQEAFDTNWVAPLGPNVENFENDLAAYLGENVYAAALSTGTAALHLALILLGVNRGDEVICQSMTFSASANPIVYLGATPVFVDSESETWNMCPVNLELAIKDRIRKGKKPKAIIAVHLYGMPYKSDEIKRIAGKYEIPVLEDAAEALGSSYKNKKCGSLGDISILSFNGNKIITTSGGGALVTRNKDFKTRAVFLATQARDEASHYEHSQIGYNYRMSNVIAGIGRGQMEVLPLRVRQRRDVFERYKKHLSGIEGITFLEEPADTFSNRWLTTILIDPGKTQGIDREEIRIHLASQNIESRPLWKPMHLQPVFKESPYYGSDCGESLFKKGLCLPSGSNLSDGDLDRVLDEVKNVVRQSSFCAV